MRLRRGTGSDCGAGGQVSKETLATRSILRLSGEEKGVRLGVGDKTGRFAATIGSCCK